MATKIQKQYTCDFCNELIPLNEYVNVHINSITNERKNYCCKCVEWCETSKKQI